ncbi:MAG: MFS transporter [Flavobacteriales bacterium]|nr:MFS transporter [Flavobacteriales bacterium]
MNTTKPKLSILQIINMSMGFLGIQMGFALQNANASRIFANFGADVHDLGYVWLVAPIVGLIVQPIIGHMGDHTWTKLGRRKPYFLVGALLACVGLIFLPNSPYLIDEGMKTTHFLGFSVTIWIGIFFLAFMDGSFNISMEPFRALVGDMLPKSQGSLGFSVQTILIGIGAVIGSVIPSILTYFGVSNQAPEGYVPNSVIYSFYIGALVLILTILYTIVTTKEYTPQEFNQFAGKEDATNEVKSSFKDIFVDFANMPVRMKRLGIVQFFSWFALFMMWVYTTSAVATHHFGLSPDDTHSAMYNNAGNKVGELFGQYNFWAIPFAFLLIPFAKFTSRKFTHFIALLFGALGYVSIYFITDSDYLFIPMIGIGFAWASILAMPYALLIDSIPVHKMGIYMGIFNFFIVIPQIINGLISPYIVKNLFNNYAIYMLVLSGVSMFIAALLTLRIKEPLFGEAEKLSE